jgi:Tol biopolymer transport system component
MKYLSLALLASSLLLVTKNLKAASSKSEPWIRVGSTLNHIKADPKKGRYIAYTDEKAGALYILDLKSKRTINVSDKAVDGSFVWSPDGVRLIYREQEKLKNTVKGSLMVFDMFLNKKIKLDDIDSQSGYISFDPRDYKLLLMHEEGVIQKSIKLPDSRLAKWQMRKSSKTGRWVASPGGVVFLSPSGKEMKKLKDDNSGVDSFAISPDGSKIAWATKKAAIFVAHDGQDSSFLDYGKDPKWDSSSSRVVYSGAHLIGQKVSGFDLKISDLNKNRKWLTHTSLSNERWPEILPNGSIIYTKASTTDLYTTEIKK